MASITTLPFAAVAFIFFLLLLIIIPRYTNSNWNIHILLKLSPSLFLTFDHLNNKIAELLNINDGTIQCSLFATEILITADPANVRHMTSTNFPGYPKGTKWRERIDILGDTLFSSDFEVWEKQRKFFRAFTGHQNFQRIMAEIVPESVNQGFIPVLRDFAKEGTIVDLQDLFQRHIFDIACKMTFGYDPKSLHSGSESKENSFSKAIEDACEAVFFRYIVPEKFWKLQRWLGNGKEKKFKAAWGKLDRIFAEIISKKEILAFPFSFKDYLTNGHGEIAKSAPIYKFLRDNILSLIFATQDTTSSALSWFFYLLSTHPSVESKIRDEIQKISSELDSGNLFRQQDLNKLVYLHAALCETLRLYPSAPFINRVPIKPDILPSGHRVNEKTNILIGAYAMGRMRAVWGEDCYEFKPERWIEREREGGGERIKHVAQYKFVAFSAGPRVCLGKQVAFVLMKATAAAILGKFDVRVVEKHPVVPMNSFIYHMKYGLLATVKSKG